MSDLLYETSNGVAIITINRPAQLNAMNTAVREGLRDAWRRFEADVSARVAILTGAGGTDGHSYGATAGCDRMLFLHGAHPDERCAGVACDSPPWPDPTWL